MVMSKVLKAMPCPVTVVGEITAENTGKVKLVDNSGKPYRIKKTGWDHFNK
jgi:thiamine monophosphate kinase